MGRRYDIDWEAIERDYRAGVLSVQAISDAHAVSHSQIREKAKKLGWTRDLSEAIAARTKAKIAAIDVADIVEQSAKQSAGKSAALIKDAIEQASDVAAGIVLKHRASLRVDADRAERVEALFDELMDKADSVRDITSLAQALKALFDARAKVRDQERTVFGLDKQADPGDKAIGERLTKALSGL